MIGTIRLRSGRWLFQQPSPEKQIPSSLTGLFLVVWMSISAAVPSCLAEEAGNAIYTVKGMIPDSLVGRASVLKLELFKNDVAHPDEITIAATAAINEKGEFECTVQDAKPANGGRLFLMRVEAEGYAPCMGSVWCNDKEIGVAKFQRPYKASEAVHYTGIILDLESRRPLPCMRLYMLGEGVVIGRSDRQGRFDLYVQQGNADYSVWHEGWCAQTFSHPGVHGGESYDVVIYQEHGVSMKIKVVDGDGNPVANAHVSWGNAGGREGMTDKDGLITLSNLSALRPGRLVVSAASFVGRTLEPLYAAEYSTQSLVVTLQGKTP